MRRKRRAIRYQPLQAIARAIHRGCWFGEPLPKGWTVKWVGFMRGAAGLCDYGGRRILLSWGDHGPDRKIRMVPGSYMVDVYPDGILRKPRSCPVHTLVHEYVHMHGHRRHGHEFDMHVEAAMARLWAAVA